MRGVGEGREERGWEEAVRRVVGRGDFSEPRSLAVVQSS